MNQRAILNTPIFCRNRRKRIPVLLLSWRQTHRIQRLATPGTYWDAGQLKYLYGEIERLKEVFANAIANTTGGISKARSERMDQPKFQNWVLEDFRQAVKARAKAIEYYYQLAHLRPNNRLDPATRRDLEVRRKQALEATGDCLNNVQKHVFEDVQDSVEYLRHDASQYLGKLLGTSLEVTVEVPHHLLHDVQAPPESQKQTE